VVNDVAAVNIDAKLIRNQNNSDAKTSTSDLAPTIELQNGCACALLILYAKAALLLHVDQAESKGLSTPGVHCFQERLCNQAKRAFGCTHAMFRQPSVARRRTDACLMAGQAGVALRGLRVGLCGVLRLAGRRLQYILRIISTPICAC
jgi:hypothetical protein